MLKVQSFIGITLLVVLVGITGCQKPNEMPTDTFTATYILENGRNFSISGRSNGMPGERSEYMLKINNNDERWQDEYYILLVDSDSIIQEIRHGELDIPGGGGIQEPANVEFPKDFTGALGLCVFIPQHGRLIATLSVGVDDAIATGWPDVTQLIQSAKTGS
jgi:hypothetical protein